MAQAVSYWPLAVEAQVRAQVRAQVSLCGICSGQSSSGIHYFSEFSGFLLSISFQHVSP
jgi:hypothetical protein